MESGSMGSGLREGSEGSISPAPSDISSSSRTPSPIVTHRGQLPELFDDRGLNGYGETFDAAGSGYDHGSDSATRYAEIILDYFISESTTIPPLLINPPADFDPNDETPYTFVLAGANLRAFNYNIKPINDRKYVVSVLSHMIVPDFKPDPGVKIQADDN